MDTALLEAPPMAADRLLTRAEVAALLRVSERTIDRLATAGALTRLHIGALRRSVRYSETQARALLAERGPDREDT